MANTNPSILHSFIENIDWDLPLEDLKKHITEHVTTYCKNNMHKVRMTREIANFTNLESLQRYTFNALLKFDGFGVIGLLPR